MLNPAADTTGGKNTAFSENALFDEMRVGIIVSIRRITMREKLSVPALSLELGLAPQATDALLRAGSLSLLREQWLKLLTWVEDQDNQLINRLLGRMRQMGVRDAQLARLCNITPGLLALWLHTPSAPRLADSVFKPCFAPAASASASSSDGKAAVPLSQAMSGASSSAVVAQSSRAVPLDLRAGLEAAVAPWLATADQQHGSLLVSNTGRFTMEQVCAPLTLTPEQIALTFDHERVRLTSPAPAPSPASKPPAPPQLPLSQPRPQPQPQPRPLAHPNGTQPQTQTRTINRTPTHTPAQAQAQPPSVGASSGSAAVDTHATLMRAVALAAEAAALVGAGTQLPQQLAQLGLAPAQTPAQRPAASKSKKAKSRDDDSSASSRSHSSRSSGRKRSAVSSYADYADVEFSDEDEWTEALAVQAHAIPPSKRPRTQSQPQGYTPSATQSAKENDMPKPRGKKQKPPAVLSASGEQRRTELMAHLEHIFWRDSTSRMKLCTDTGWSASVMSGVVRRNFFGGGLREKLEAMQDWAQNCDARFVSFIKSRLPAWSVTPEQLAARLAVALPVFHRYLRIPFTPCPEFPGGGNQPAHNPEPADPEFMPFVMRSPIDVRVLQWLVDTHSKEKGRPNTGDGSTRMLGWKEIAADYRWDPNTIAVVKEEERPWVFIERTELLVTKRKAKKQRAEWLAGSADSKLVLARVKPKGPAQTQAHASAPAAQPPSQPRPLSDVIASVALAAVSGGASSGSISAPQQTPAAAKKPKGPLSIQRLPFQQRVALLSRARRLGGLLQLPDVDYERDDSPAASPNISPFLGPLPSPADASLAVFNFPPPPASFASPSSGPAHTPAHTPSHTPAHTPSQASSSTGTGKKDRRPRKQYMKERVVRLSTEKTFAGYQYALAADHDVPVLLKRVHEVMKRENKSQTHVANAAGISVSVASLLLTQKYKFQVGDKHHRFADWAYRLDSALTADVRAVLSGRLEKEKEGEKELAKIDVEAQGIDAEAESGKDEKKQQQPAKPQLKLSDSEAAMLLLPMLEADLPEYAPEILRLVAVGVPELREQAAEMVQSPTPRSFAQSAAMSNKLQQWLDLSMPLPERSAWDQLAVLWLDLPANADYERPRDEQPKTAVPPTPSKTPIKSEPVSMELSDDEKQSDDDGTSARKRRKAQARKKIMKITEFESSEEEDSDLEQAIKRSLAESGSEAEAKDKDKEKDKGDGKQADTQTEQGGLAAAVNGKDEKDTVKESKDGEGQEPKAKKEKKSKQKPKSKRERAEDDDFVMESDQSESESDSETGLESEAEERSDESGSEWEEPSENEEDISMLSAEEKQYRRELMQERREERERQQGGKITRKRPEKKSRNVLPGMPGYKSKAKKVGRRRESKHSQREETAKLREPLPPRRRTPGGPLRTQPQLFASPLWRILWSSISTGLVRAGDLDLSKHIYPGMQTSIAQIEGYREQLSVPAFTALPEPSHAHLMEQPQAQQQQQQAEAGASSGSGLGVFSLLESSSHAQPPKDKAKGPAANAPALINVGAPVFACEWVPVGDTEHAAVKCAQWLMIAGSAKQKLHNWRHQTTAQSGDRLLQLWHMGTPLKPSCPRLAMCLLHDYGHVWSMQWLSDGAWQPSVLDATDDSKEKDKGKDAKAESESSSGDELKRLGVLAIAFSDGSVRVVSVPHPTELSTRAGPAAAERALPFPVVRLSSLPGLSMRLPTRTITEKDFSNAIKPKQDKNKVKKDKDKNAEVTFSYQPIPTVVSWSSRPSKCRLFAGYSDGTLALWDLTPFSSSTAPSLPSAASIEPQWHIYAHTVGYPVRAIACHPARDSIAVSGEDGSVHVWDLDRVARAKEHAIIVDNQPLTVKPRHTWDNLNMPCVAAFWVNEPDKEDQLLVSSSRATEANTSSNRQMRVLELIDDGFVSQYYIPVASFLPFRPLSNINSVSVLNTGDKYLHVCTASSAGEVFLATHPLRLVSWPKRIPKQKFDSGLITRGISVTTPLHSEESKAEGQAQLHAQAQDIKQQTPLERPNTAVDAAWSRSPMGPEVQVLAMREGDLSHSALLRVCPNPKPAALSFVSGFGVLESGSAKHAAEKRSKEQAKLPAFSLREHLLDTNVGLTCVRLNPNLYFPRWVISGGLAGLVRFQVLTES